MPRIRSLKPEHKQHRKVGALSDRNYRLWLGMLTEADDEGRIVCDVSQLRALIFAYHPKVSPKHVEVGLAHLAEVGLIRLYHVAGLRYADFPSWRDHQKINRPVPSKLPSYKDSLRTHGGVSEDSVKTQGGLTTDLIGSDLDLIGSDRKGGERGGKPTPERQASAARRGGAPPPGADTTGPDQETALLKIRREDAPPSWFHDCAEGRLFQRCVKAEYAERVDLFVQCDFHFHKRELGEAAP